MPYDRIRLDVEERIARLTLARPGAANAIDGRAASELRDACERVRQDDAVWVLLLQAEGDVFCAGADPAALAELTALDAHALPPELAGLRVAAAVAAVEKPVIAALSGDALDQGLELALACDVRVASLDARFGMTQLARGLLPWDGGTQRLPRLVGRGPASEMLLAGATLDARRAVEIGLVNEAVEPGRVAARAGEIAAAVASHGPIATRYTKELVHDGLDMTLDQGLRLEGDLNFILQSTADRAEGVASFLERRGPRSTGGSRIIHEGHEGARREGGGNFGGTRTAHDPHPNRKA